MVNNFKQFTNYYAKNLNLDNIEWDTFKYGQLFNLIYEDAKIQIYPYQVIKYRVNQTDLVEYDHRCDGKRYFSAGLMDNGFTPKHTIGTCRGNIQRLYDLVDAILEYHEDKLTNAMNDALNDFAGIEYLEFSFNDYDEASIYVHKPEWVMEDEDEIVNIALNVFKKFNVKVSYEWDYDAGDEYSRCCSLDFVIDKGL